MRPPEDVVRAAVVHERGSVIATSVAATGRSSGASTWPSASCRRFQKTRRNALVRWRRPSSRWRTGCPRRRRRRSGGQVRELQRQVQVREDAAAERERRRRRGVRLESSRRVLHEAALRGSSTAPPPWTGTVSRARSEPCPPCRQPLESARRVRGSGAPNSAADARERERVAERDAARADLYRREARPAGSSAARAPTAARRADARRRRRAHGALLMAARSPCASGGSN